jgi:hypothetical protein
MLRTVAACALLLAGTLAGCLGAPPPALPPVPAPLPTLPDWAARALPFGQGHNHSRAAEHQGLSTADFEVLGWDPLATDYYGGAGAGTYYCGEATQTPEGRRLAVVNGFASDVAFVLVDVTDPARPQKVGEYALARAHVYDVAITADGKHVVVGTTSIDNPEKAAGALPGPGLERVQPRWRDACTGGERDAGPEQLLPLGSSVLLVGVQDLAEPVLEDAVPAPPRGPHSVSTALVDGKQLVLASVQYTLHLASLFYFLEVQQGPLGAKLHLLSTYDPPPSPQREPVTNGHVDGSIQKHPLTGRTLAYLADWDGGMVVVDITDPAMPTTLAVWSDYPGPLGEGDALGHIHATLPIEGTWDGHHFTIAGQELGGRPKTRPSGWIHILDTTDPSRPTEAGRWTLPVDVTWDAGLIFSTHYFALQDRVLFVSMYHAGVWAVDLRDAGKLADPPAIGVFIPANEPPKPPAHPSTAPETLQVLAFPDSLLVYDANSGVYAVRFDAAHPAPSPPTWKV